MKDNQQSAPSSDLFLRSSSLILYAVIIGLSLQFGIERILEPNVEFGVFPNFVTFLITAVRFFHGNYIYHDKPRREHPFRFMLNFYFNIVELVALCIVGRLIDERFSFIYALLGLSLIDIIWAIISIYFTKDAKERYIFRIWGLLNTGSALFLTLLIVFHYGALGNVSILILAFYICVTILDYRLCRGYYFGRKSEIQ